MRLEAKLCTRDDTPDLSAQILTRFITPDGKKIPEETAGSPRLTNAPTQRFQRRNGINELNETAILVSPENAASSAREMIRNPVRTMPVVVITEDQNGQYALYPEKCRALYKASPWSSATTAFAEAVTKAALDTWVKTTAALEDSDDAPAHQSAGRRRAAGTGTAGRIPAS